jgi:site-specific DNA recombinase
MTSKQHLTSTNSAETYADAYLRLSDFRADDADSFGARETKLRAEAARLGWHVRHVITENDVTADGRRKPASAYKRQLVRRADGSPEMRFGRKVYRVLRPGWRSVLEDLGSGAATAVLAEDLDRVARDARDIEDLIDAVSACGGHARSLSGSLTLTAGGRSDEIAMARVMTAMGAKSSADTARRVADGRERSALAGSYGGGRRPFGFTADPDAPKGQRTLIIVPSEAAVIRRAASAVLAETASDAKSLAFLARELRAAGTPTVTGAAWTPETLKDILIKPAVAGIAVNTRTRTETAGAWDAILPREIWEACRAILTDPARRTNATNANAPRWLGSGLYQCGVCADGTSVTVHGGRGRSKAYVCHSTPHIRRNAAATDDYVAFMIIDRLSRPDAANLLRPPVRPGIDTVALRAEQKRLEIAGTSQARMHALGEITDSEMRAGSRLRQARLAEIAGQLSAVTAPDPLAEFRGAPDAGAVWDALPLARKRGVLAVLARVTLLPAARRGSGFDLASVRVEPIHPGA